jgi:acyl carrier protein
MDSLQVVELIVDLEDCFEFCIPEPLLTPEVFAGPATIWKAIGPLVSVADS